MAESIHTHLMFEGSCEEALDLYVSVFPNSEITDITRFEEGDHVGKVMIASCMINGTKVTAIDSPQPHDFTFTPSMSFFVDCESEDALISVFKKLSEGGTVRMPIDNYGFSKLFGWIDDKFGVSWQLNLT